MSYRDERSVFVSISFIATAYDCYMCGRNVKSGYTATQNSEPFESFMFCKSCGELACKCYPELFKLGK